MKGRAVEKQENAMEKEEEEEGEEGEEMVGEIESCVGAASAVSHRSTDGLTAHKIIPFYSMQARQCLAASFAMVERLVQRAWEVTLRDSPSGVGASPRPGGSSSSRPGNDGHYPPNP